MGTGYADNREQADQREQYETLRVRLAEAEEMLRAIQRGEIDALVVEGAGGNQVYTLHSAEEPYRNLVEQMQEGAVVLTSHGDILYANARFAALVGEPLQSVTGSQFGRFVHASDKDDVATLLGLDDGRGRCRLLGRRRFWRRRRLVVLVNEIASHDHDDRGYGDPNLLHGALP